MQSGHLSIPSYLEDRFLYRYRDTDIYIYTHTYKILLIKPWNFLESSLCCFSGVWAGRKQDLREGGCSPEVDCSGKCKERGTGTRNNVYGPQRNFWSPWPGRPSGPPEANPMASRPASFLAPDQQSVARDLFCRVELALTQPGIYGQGQCPVYEDGQVASVLSTRMASASSLTFSFPICKMGNHL